jgi:hypothetical protein
MSRYTTKKHGLILGSGNVFFINEQNPPEGVPEFRQYNAVVWCDGYRFDHCDTSTCHIRTPAEQLIWSGRYQRETEFEMEGKKYPRLIFYRELMHYPRYWLNENVGALHDMWDIRTLNDCPSCTIFFKRRKDALAFCAMVAERLAGMHIGDPR